MSKESETIHYVAGRKGALEVLEHEPNCVDAIFVQEGVRGGDIDALFTLGKKHGLQRKVLPKPQLDKMHPSNHQGVLLRLYAPGFLELEQILGLLPDSPLPVLLALDQVQDAGNVGTLARTLFALGGAGLLIPRHNSAMLGAGAVKASAGVLARLPICKVTNLGQALQECAGQGIAVYAAQSGPEAVSLFDLKPRFPAVLVVGNEDKGVRPGVLKHCEQVHIPMAGKIDSINVAQAGAMMLGRLLQAKLVSPPSQGDRI